MLNKTMLLKLFTLLGLIILFIDKVTRAQKFSCIQNAKGLDMEKYLEDLSGVWYEVIRFPVSAVPACVKVTAPESIENDNYALKVNYMENMEKPWIPWQEQFNFTWNDSTKRGTFVIHYAEENAAVDVTFTIMRQLFRDYLLVCGYAPAISKMELFKVLSRQTIVPESDQQDLLKLMQVFGIQKPSSMITWVEHGDVCSGAKVYRTHAATTAISLITFSILQILNKILNN